MKPINRVIYPLLFLLVLLACNKKGAHEQSFAVKYTCPMHPKIIQEQPGTCPICGMDLVMLKQEGDTAEIMLSETQIRLGNITTTLIRYGEIGNNTLLTGRLAINEDQTEIISSRVAGRIEKLAIKETGQRIAVGQPLYEIYSEPLLTLEQEYLLALQQANELGNQEKRYVSFLEAAEKKLLLFGLTHAQVTELSKTKAVNSRISFPSPTTGIVGRIDVAEGQYVAEGSSLYRIEQLDKIWVEADLYPSESSWVRLGDLVDVVVPGVEATPVKGKVTFLSPEYRAGSQIITLRAEIANPNHIFQPGTQANVLLSHATHQALSLPLDAVIRDERGSLVWVLTSAGAYRPKIVKTGIETATDIEIISGLEEKENVVITGAYLLYSELVLKKGQDPMAGLAHQH